MRVDPQVLKTWQFPMALMPMRLRRIRGLELLCQGKSPEEVARAVGVHPRTAWSWCVNLCIAAPGLVLRRRGEALLRQGVPTRDITHALGVSAKTVQRWRRALELPRGPELRRQAALGLLQRGRSDREVARSTGITETTARRWRGELGRDPGRPPVSSAEGFRLLREGRSSAEVRKLMGVDARTVELWRRRLGLPPGATRPTASHPPARLPEIPPLPPEAREMMRRGATDMQIAQRCGMAVGTVCMWRVRLMRGWAP